MNASESAHALNQDELDQLDALLAQAHPDDAMMLEEYDGFCAALACSPTAISADECLPLILGEEPGSALARLAPAERSALLALLSRHRRAVAARLEESEAWNALIGTDEEGRALGDAWAIGFLRGMSIRPDDWSALDDDEVCEEVLELMLRFAGEASGDDDSGDDEPGKADPIEDDERDELIELMLDGVGEIFTRLAPLRARPSH